MYANKWINMPYTKQTESTLKCSDSYLAIKRLREDETVRHLVDSRIDKYTEHRGVQRERLGTEIDRNREWTRRFDVEGAVFAERVRSRCASDVGRGRLGRDVDNGVDRGQPGTPWRTRGICRRARVVETVRAVKVRVLGRCETFSDGRHRSAVRCVDARNVERDRRVTSERMCVCV